MAVTLEQAVEQLDTQLRKARQELAQAESAKSRLWEEVAEAKRKSAEELAKVKAETEAEKARLVAVLPTLRQQESALRQYIEQLQRECEETKHRTDAAIASVRIEQNKERAETTRTVSEGVAKLAQLRQQYADFLAELPKGL